MDDTEVRNAAGLFGDALVAGNVDAAIEYLSDELKRNLGEVVALLPLPATAIEITSLERSFAAVVMVLRVVGETADDELQLRWKDRDGAPRIVEVGHIRRTERARTPEAEGEGADTEAETPGPAA